MTTSDRMDPAKQPPSGTTGRRWRCRSSERAARCGSTPRSFISPSRTRRPELNIGQPLTVMVQRGTPVTGLILSARRRRPQHQWREHRLAAHRAGTLRAEAGPHTFRSMPAVVVVAAGISQRERIVVRGTDLINQIR